MTVISNASKTELSALLRETRSRYPAFGRVLDAVARRPGAFRCTPSASGIEIGLDDPREPRRERCRMKLFEIKPGRFAAFFYKTSLVPFSTDRFSYGAVTFGPGEPDEAEVDGWLAYLDSGFDWDRTPPKLRRALAFDVPD